MGRATFVILAVLCYSWAGAEQAVNPPPRPLHKVDDHWTPYDPPKEFPADAEVYIIVKGDTLSKIAAKYYGDPSLYTKIFEANRDLVKNPDLIQVGWKLRIP